MTDSETQRIVGAQGEHLDVPRELPVLPVRDVVLYPGGTIPLQIGRARSLAALEQAGSTGLLLIATQYEASTEEPMLHDLYPERRWLGSCE